MVGWDRTRMDPQRKNGLLCVCYSHMLFLLLVSVVHSTWCLTITPVHCRRTFRAEFLKVAPPCQLFCCRSPSSLLCSGSLRVSDIWFALLIFVRSPSAFIAAFPLLCTRHQSTRAFNVRCLLCGGHFRLHQQTQTNCIVCALAFH